MCIYKQVKKCIAILYNLNFQKIFVKELLVKLPSDTNCRLFPYNFSIKERFLLLIALLSYL